MTDLESLSSFALLGPGWGASSGRWTLLRDLHPSSGGDGIWLAAFEEREPRCWSAATREPYKFEPNVDAGAPVIHLRRKDYDQSVEKIREFIRAGDVYQVCLTRPANLGPSTGRDLLSRLCARGVPPFAAWIRLPDGREIVSGSPELFFLIEGPLVHTMPMKGTARAADAAALRESEKDMAELAMITDLLRNDLRSVCTPKSVRVHNARKTIELPYATQTVSHIVGALAPAMGPREVLTALHPGGSITGAPKQAALDILSALEPSPRGVYTGALGYVQGKNAVFSLLIRTAVKSPEGWTYGVGGGITIDSTADGEWQELYVKLGALGDLHP